MAVIADLNNIKTQVSAIFTAANDTAASYDLSQGLTERVHEILKVNPEKIVPQASMFPLVTSFVVSKSVISQGIAKDQVTPKRRARVELNIVGAFWNDNISSVDEDPADEDICQLMENIELVLRSNPTLNGSVLWHQPNDVKYYTTILDEQTHLRSGILVLECEIFY